MTRENWYGYWNVQSEDGQRSFFYNFGRLRFAAGTNDFTQDCVLFFSFQLGRCKDFTQDVIYQLEDFERVGGRNLKFKSNYSVYDGLSICKSTQYPYNTKNSFSKLKITIALQIPTCEDLKKLNPSLSPLCT